MKKLLLSSVVIVSFVGCGSNENSTDLSFASQTGCEMIADLEGTSSQNIRVTFDNLGKDILESEKGYNLVSHESSSIKEGTYVISFTDDYKPGATFFSSGKLIVDAALYRYENGRKRKVQVATEQKSVRNVKNIQNAMNQAMTDVLKKLPDCSL